MVETFEELPADPEAAFVILEQEFRLDYQREIENADNNSWADEARLTYAGRVRAALEELSIEYDFVIQDFANPKVDYERFQTFRRDVETLITKIRIRVSRAQSRNSVKLDANMKSKLRQLLEKVKEAILELDEGEIKRNTLLSKIAALEQEIERTRTRYEVVAALWIDLCDKAGEGLNKLEPARKWLDSMARLIAQAKSLEPEAPALPKREPHPRIEKSKDVSDIVDDDIPF